MSQEHDDNEEKEYNSTGCILAAIAFAIIVWALDGFPGLG